MDSALKSAMVIVTAYPENYVLTETVKSDVPLMLAAILTKSVSTTSADALTVLFPDPRNAWTSTNVKKILAIRPRSVSIYMAVTGASAHKAQQVIQPVLAAQLRTNATQISIVRKIRHASNTVAQILAPSQIAVPMLFAQSSIMQLPANVKLVTLEMLLAALKLNAYQIMTALEINTVTLIPTNVQVSIVSN